MFYVLVYILFGAADVALTEALVGTMLSITLYAVAVRSSLNMRVGVLEEESHLISQMPPLTNAGDSPTEPKSPVDQMMSSLRKALRRYHMRLELITYTDQPSLNAALMSKEIHTTCVLSEQWVDRESRQLNPLILFLFNFCLILPGLWFLLVHFSGEL